MSSDIFNEGKTTYFNEAAFRMQRIHEDQKLVSDLMTNLLTWNSNYGKFNYEVVISKMLWLMNQSFGKMNTDEKDKYTKYRSAINNLLEFKPIFSQRTSYGVGGKEIYTIKDLDNYLKTRDMIYEMQDFVQELFERVGYGSPNVEEEGGYD